VKVGSVVRCAIRGKLVVVALSDGRIRWPLGKRGGTKCLLVFGDLERALRTESASAVCYWWGVTNQTVSKWRKALGVPEFTLGTSQLKRELLAPRGDAMRAKIDFSDPVRKTKIGAALRGRRPSRKTVAAARRANKGRALSAEHRQKIREANLRNGNWPPKAGRPWTAEEDEWLRLLPVSEVARRTKRTLAAVYVRKSKLG